MTNSISKHRKKLLTFSLFLSLTTSATQSIALPVLSEAAGKREYGNITIWPDSEDANKFYFFPNSTKFATDNKGVPLFSFVYWGFSSKEASADKGAYMSMTTKLDADHEMQISIDKFLANHPGATLAVAPVKHSTIGLTSTSGQAPLGSLFKEFNFAKVGGRAEDEIGINAVLNETGARAFKGLLSKSPGGSPIKFDYCYILQGYGPNMVAEIKVDFRRVYDYFEASSSGGYLWFSYSIRTVVEKLFKEGAVSIELKGGDASSWEMLLAVADQITKRLFVPTLSASPDRVGEAESNRPFRFGAGIVHKEELSVENWKWKRQDLVEREFCTSINLKDIGPFRDQLIIDADQN